MSYTLGPTLAVGGEKEYMAAMKNVRESMKYVKAEADAAISVYGKNEKSVQALTTQINNSKKAFDVQKTAVKAAEDALERMKTNGVDESSTAYKRMEANLNTAKAAMNNTSREIDEQEKELKQAADAADEMARAEKTMGDHAKKAGTEMKGAGTQATGLKGKIKDFAKSSVGQMATFAGAFALAVKAVKALANILNDSMNWADGLNTLSQQTGVATEKLQELEYTSKFVDTSVETITGSMKKLSVNMYQASIGTKQQQDAFDALGVSYLDGNGNLRDNQEVFYEMIDVLGRMTNETERDAIAMLLMGKSAQDLNPLIKAGSTALEGYGEEAKTSGSIVDRITIAALQKLDDKFEETALVTETNTKKMSTAMLEAADAGATLWQQIQGDITNWPNNQLETILIAGRQTKESARELVSTYQEVSAAQYASELENDAFLASVQEMTDYLIAQGVPAEQAQADALVNVAEKYDAASYAQDQMTAAQGKWDDKINASLELYKTKQAEYLAAVAQTSEAYLSDMGSLFDGFDAELAGSQKELDSMTTSLLENLQSQVDGIEGWADEMDKLSKRGIDEGLLQELRDMGPEAYAEIQALNNATDVQLQVYEGLYKTRSEAATEASKKALEPMAQDVEDALKLAEKAVEDSTSEMYKLGKNLAKGIGDGINTYSWYVVREAEQAVKDAVKAASKASGSGSTSSNYSDGYFKMYGEGGIVTYPHTAIVGDVPEIIIPFNSSARSLELLDIANQRIGKNTTTREVIRDSGLTVNFGNVSISNDMDIKTLAQKLGYEYRRAQAAQGG